MSDDKLLLEISELLDAKLQPMQEEIRQVKMRIERDVVPRLKNIESCYTDTYDRYRIGVERIDALEKDVMILKRIVKEQIG